MKITIIGGGTWGTTLADMYSRKGYDTLLWLRKEISADEINSKNTNSNYTKSKKLSSRIKATNQTKGIFSERDIIIIAVPSHAMRDILKMFLKEFEATDLQKLISVINVAKGLEVGTNKRMSEIFDEILPKNMRKKITTLSGPNIALEILDGLPSVSVIAGPDNTILKRLQPIISTEYFRIYTNTDVTGVELCGALKNIVAIASGISDGLGYGANAKASLVTRGLNELQRFGNFFGANPKTFSGVAGMGDLVTTCISSKSRNRYVGEMLAKGKSIKEISNSMNMVAEGINTTKAVYSVARRKGIELPITESVYDILYNKKDPSDSVNLLMQRKFKSEV